jgi:hypothetical protein
VSSSSFSRVVFFFRARLLPCFTVSTSDRVYVGRSRPTDEPSRSLA